MMESSIFRYILKYSWREQLYIISITLISFPFLYGTLDLPKIIINKAIGGGEFPQTFYGFSFDQIQYLMALCLLFLALVLIRYAFRYYINVYKGQLAERMLRRLRYQLFSLVLRFPLPHFRSASQGELIAMMTGEVEPVGGFTGDAFALPAFEGGTLLTIVFFMFVQDWQMGLAAIALFPVQAIIIPRLQRQVNALAKERVRTVRKLSERIGEVVSGIEDVHAHDTAELERAHYTQWIGRIYAIRFDIYRKKFFIKFLNNLFSQLTPFFFFSIGGYLVIKGELTFGALVAVLAAYKDMSSPWKELLTWYEQKEDARIKYEQIVEQFRPRGMLDEALQALPDVQPPPLTGPLAASNVTFVEEDGVRIVDGVSLSFDIGDRIALGGREGSGQGHLSKLLARLLVPTSGLIRIGNDELSGLPEWITGRRVAYMGYGGVLFQGTLRDNLLYGLRHQPVIETVYEGDDRARREKYVKDAADAGNTTSDPDTDWIDYAAAGVDGPEPLREHLLDVLRLVELEADVFAFGLQGRIDPERRPDLAARILEARALLSERLSEEAHRGLIERFDPQRFSPNMSIAENLLFGTPVGPAFELSQIAENPYVLEVLARAQLTDVFIDTGLQVARVMVSLFGDAEPGNELLERYSFISIDDLPVYQAVIRRVEQGDIRSLDDKDRALLMSLPFKLIPARHRVHLVGDDADARILEARRLFAANLPAALRASVAFFDADRYNPAASVQDNILFGRLVYERQQSQRVVGALLDAVIDLLDLRPTIADIGLDYVVGLGGSRLSAVQRHKVVIARGLLKHADVIIVDRATAALDPATQQRILTAVLESNPDAAILWVLNEADDESLFDHVYVMEHGRIVAHRTPRAEAGTRPSDAMAAES